MIPIFGGDFSYAPEVSATLETTCGDYSRADGFTALAFHVDAQPDEMRFDPHVSASLTCSQRAGAMVGTCVRRLTPRECERLQGFEDDYTRVPLFNKKGKPTGKFLKDGPRYKALGNSMAVPVMRWIGERIQAVSDIQSIKAAV